MKIIRRSLLALAFSIGAAGCSTSSILAPDCDDLTACAHQPGTDSEYQPGTGS
jgi:hypothetical protein